MEKFNWFGLEEQFVCAGILRPALCSDGSIYEYNCYYGHKYESDPNYEIMKLDNQNIGDKNFCYFVIDRNANSSYKKTDNLKTATVDALPRKKGVYVWKIEDKIVYVGRATNDRSNSLYSRFKNGYGRISPRNCVKNITNESSGQLTNLKMNRVVLESYKENKKIELYYYCCDDPVGVEAILIDGNWNLKEQNLALIYNSRHERLKSK